MVSIAMSTARKKEKKVTATYLERAAFHYLGRFASTRVNLGRVLERKVRRRHDDHSPPSAEERAWIDAVAEKCQRLGLVDDKIYARGKVHSLHRAGKSLHQIRGYLISRGTEAAAIGEALEELAAEHQDPDLIAVAACARKRRLGPYRVLRMRQSADRDPAKTREKDLASLARAGFRFDVARRILDCASPDEVEALIDNSTD